MGVFLKKKKSAVIITGNSEVINSAEWKSSADKFYNDIKMYLESKNYTVTLDPGKEFTRPKKADLWIGHSKGNGRLKFAYGGTKTLRFGDKGGINHPKDISLQKGDGINIYHFTFCNEMRDAIDIVDIEIMEGR